MPHYAKCDVISQQNKNSEVQRKTIAELVFSGIVGRNLGTKRVSCPNFVLQYHCRRVRYQGPWQYELSIFLYFSAFDILELHIFGSSSSAQKLENEFLRMHKIHSNIYAGRIKKMSRLQNRF